MLQVNVGALLLEQGQAAARVLGALAERAQLRRRVLAQAEAASWQEKASVACAGTWPGCEAEGRGQGGGAEGRESTYEAVMRAQLGAALMMCE